MPPSVGTSKTRDMDDLAQTLDKFAVPPAERAEVVAIVEGTRADIVI
jgi:hypothetical protein